ncbi:MAG: TolC family protein [Verrucomicrobiales bacterium]|jgi:outer membrane protein TolC|nr:TolC family protein [Verrucomicrobiales bacterium]
MRLLNHIAWQIILSLTVSVPALLCAQPSAGGDPAAVPKLTGSNIFTGGTLVSTDTLALTAPSGTSADPDAATPATVLTWEECVQLAAIHNPALEASRNNVLNADAVRKASYSNLYPQIRASVSGNRAYKEDNGYTNYGNSFSAQLSLTQTIFDGLATQAGIDRARAQLNHSYASLNSQKAATSYALKSAFAQLLYAQELVETNRDILAMRRQNERLIGLRFEGGFESKGNWLITVASRDQAQFDLNQAVRNREVSERQLLTVIGNLNFPLPLAVSGQLRAGVLPAKPDFDQLAVRTPAYFQYQAQAEAARAGVQIAESGWWPTISASISGGTSDDSFFPSQTASASGGVSVSYALFNGGQTYFNVAASQASLRQTLAQLRGGTNQAALTLAQAFKSYVDMVESVPVQEILLSATELRYQTYKMLYDNGKATFQDFNNNTDYYVSQQTRYLAVRRDAVIQEANWEQARGLGAIP